jgi:hypothetical protein
LTSYIIVQYSDGSYDHAEADDGKEDTTAQEMGAKLIEICGTPEKAKRVTADLNAEVNRKRFFGP